MSVLLVPGLRDESPAHWQSLLAARLPNARALPARGKENIDLDARIDEIESAVSTAKMPVVIVAHSAGSIATIHWLLRTRLKPLGVLLATPPTFASALPPEYPSLAEFKKAGWLPLPQARLTAPCIVAASRDDPLGPFGSVGALAHSWGAELVDLGEVGHLNPASGYGEWDQAVPLIRSLVGLEVKA